MFVYNSTETFSYPVSKTNNGQFFFNINTGECMRTVKIMGKRVCVHWHDENIPSRPINAELRSSASGLASWQDCGRSNVDIAIGTNTTRPTGWSTVSDVLTSWSFNANLINLRSLMNLITSYNNNQKLRSKRKASQSQKQGGQNDLHRPP